MSHSGKNVFSFMSAEPLYFFLLLSLPGRHRFSWSCNISNVSVAKNDKRKEVQPLNLPLLSVVHSAAICALYITYGRTGMDLCFKYEFIYFFVY